jgi:hypothetical protein
VESGHKLLPVQGSESLTRDPDYLPNIALLETYTGTYVGETGTLVVECEEGALVGRSPEDDAKLRFIALGPSSFAGPIGLIEFSVSETGRVTGMTNGRSYPYHRAE